MSTGSSTVEPDRRFTKGSPCPVCGGCDGDRRGQGIRCHGFRSADGEWAHCTRDEHAGNAPLSPKSGTYAHRLRGECKCGRRHGPDEPRSKSTVECTYDYKVGGKLIHQTVRCRNPKTFKQRQPDGEGGWQWNLKGVKTVLYRLDELRGADPAQPVFVCEGEKDADRLATLGLVATTNPMGAEKWKDKFSAELKGRDVVILPDNDDSGRRHAGQVARSAHAVARCVKILELGGLPDRGDVSDWLGAGGSAAELVRLAREAAPWEPARDDSAPATVKFPDPAPAPERPNRTDTGNAIRLVRKYGDQLRYCHKWKAWLKWDGRRWREDTNGQVYQLARKTVQAIGEEASRIDDDAERKATLKWAIDSESRQRLESMILLARTDDGIPVEPGDLNADPWLFNCLNGTVDLRTGTLRPHDKADLITKIAPVKFDPEAECPRWERFESEIFAGDRGLIGYMRRALGYSLTADNRVQEINILWGDGSNGKNVLLDVIRRIMGDYARVADRGLLVAKKFDDHPTGLADLDGARLVTASETEDGRRLAEGLVKSITGDETLKARRMKKDFYEFRRTFKVFMATNHKPEIRGNDNGIWRRIMLIPFLVKFVKPGEEVAPPYRLPIVEGLIDSLVDHEAPGILAALVRGCCEWQEIGMDPPDSIRAATEGYRKEMDVIGEWIAEECFQGDTAMAGSTPLHKSYVAWCVEKRVKTIHDARTFGSKMEARGFIVKHTKHGNFRTGIGLLRKDG